MATEFLSAIIERNFPEPFLRQKCTHLEDKPEKVDVRRSVGRCCGGIQREEAEALQVQNLTNHIDAGHERLF